MTRRVGIVGYGKLGKYLFEQIQNHPEHAMSVAFVWNRTSSVVRDDPLVPSNLVLDDLDQFDQHSVDLIIEVAHPDITSRYGARFLAHADLFVGSPTAFADSSVEQALRTAAITHQHGCYIPSGALWGAVDIQKMADANTLGGVTITMKKEPTSLKVLGGVQQRLEEYIACADDTECVLFDGPARELCPLAPNNVNTIACAALAAHSLGFDGVRARLCADKRLTAHIIEIEIRGKGANDDVFRCDTTRYNPSAPGAVTGSATYVSFYSSLKRARGFGGGFHFC